MIDRKQLLADLKPLLRELEADLRARCDEVAQINADIRKEFEQARAANRAGITFEEWRADLITQVAVAWVLSSVFVRFLEDNALIDPPRISGPLHGAGDRQGLMRARDERDVFFRSHPKQTDRDYLLAIFDDLAKLPGTKDVFGLHNPVSVYRDWLSGDAAQKLIEFFQKIDADGTGEIIHDFRDRDWDTRFLGDLYQDLSEAARKKYALLQTPIFVEEFILERTLEPAIKEFGLKDLKMIDPTCGSGHFVLGGFARILNHWRKAEPGTNDRELVNRSLASVHGVDLNPYAVAIARFRLLLAAMKECRVTRLKDAPNFQFNLACGDSLLHGAGGQRVLGFHELAHHYRSEDIDALHRILKPGQYHAVVANPPYITVKDKALNQAYRDRYPEVCHMKYSLSAPFMQRLFHLAYDNGYVGQITSNSFMKREFGSKLIEEFLPKVDLTHVIDTSGAYIPHHGNPEGTPTCILFSRQRPPVASVVRTVMALRTDRKPPENLADASGWRSIVEHLDDPGFKNEWVEIQDAPREWFITHPWPFGGGGGSIATELNQLIETQAHLSLKDAINLVGVFGMTNADDAFIQPQACLRRSRVELDMCQRFVTGDQIRGWMIDDSDHAVFPYLDGCLVPIQTRKGLLRFLWPNRTDLGNRTTFSKKTYFLENRPWWEWHQVALERMQTPLTLAFPFVVTHNNFALDRGGSVFNRQAPIIKLKNEATLDEHLGLLGVLNCSVTCFWARQTLFPKGGFASGKWEERLEWDGTKVARAPLPKGRPVALAQRLDALAQQYASLMPGYIARVQVPCSQVLMRSKSQAEAIFGDIAALQEELDWECYQLFWLVTESPRYENPPPIKLGQRAFEIVLARSMAAGEEETTWFVRHGSVPITEIPAEWPEEYKRVVQRRIELIESDRNIGLIERPEYKRRWNVEAWEKQQERALRSWLLDRLESYFDIDGRMNDQKTVTARGNLHDPRLTSVAKVADLAKQDKDFMQVAEIYAKRMDFDVTNLVGDLVAAESVPCLPVLRYKPTSMDKRAAWERTWKLQRLEDAVDALFEVERLKKIEPGKAEDALRPLVATLRIDEQVKPQILREALTAARHVAEVAKQKLDPQRFVTDAAKRAKHQAIGDIPAPPKYTNADFLSSGFWRLRGKLDVPKERWVSFPHCEGEDGTLVIAWAGYDHLQLARAIAERYEHAKEHEGRKLVPLLACIGQLIPWLKQWHNELDPAFGARMGDYFENYLAEEAKALGMSVDQVMVWTPPPKAKKAGRKNKVEVE